MPKIVGGNIANFSDRILSQDFSPSNYLFLDMLYHFELQLAGIILFTAMIVGGISLWLKRRKINKELQESIESDDAWDV